MITNAAFVLSSVAWYSLCVCVCVCAVTQEYADKLTESGVHGAALVLDVGLTADMLANILAIPSTKSYVRRHLAAEFDVIVQPARCATDHSH